MQTSLLGKETVGDSPLLNFKAKQVAEGLCLLDSDLFNHLDGIEFLNQLWRSGTGDELECPNLLHLIDRFNKVLNFLFDRLNLLGLTRSWLKNCRRVHGLPPKFAAPPILGSE